MRQIDVKNPINSGGPLTVVVEDIIPDLAAPRVAYRNRVLPGETHHFQVGGTRRIVVLDGWPNQGQ